MKKLMLAFMLAAPFVQAQDIDRQEYGNCFVETETDIFTDESHHLLRCDNFTNLTPLIDDGTISEEELLLERLETSMSNITEGAYFTIALGGNYGSLGMTITMMEQFTIPEDNRISVRVDNNEVRNMTAHFSLVIAMLDLHESSLMEVLSEIQSAQQRIAIRVGEGIDAKTVTIPLHPATSGRAIAEFRERTGI